MPSRNRPAGLVTFLLLAAVVGWWTLRPGVTHRSADAGNPVVTAPAHDLERDERAGGHTLSRHVGLDELALRRRLDLEPDLTAASSFPDRATAERAVAVALESGSERIERWLGSGRRTNLVLHWPGDGRPTGRLLARGGSSPVDAHAARVVLRRHGSGFFVLTAYPEVSR